jgi:hypothetical protein
MDYLNIHIPTVLRSPEYVGSSPSERGTWLCVLSYACSIECGGVLVGAAGWKDRQWQQACGVMLREVMAAKRLLRVVGDDVEVNGYPKESEEKVRKNRKNGVAGAMARWAKASDDAMPHGMPCAIPDGMPCADGKGKEREWKEKEGKEIKLPSREEPVEDGVCDGCPGPGPDDEPPGDLEQVQTSLVDAVQPAPTGESKKKRRNKDDFSEHGFQIFWQAYPKRVGVAQAYDHWCDKMDADTRRAAAGGVEAFIAGKEIKYLPDPIRYLRNKRWMDEAVPEPEQDVQQDPWGM